MKFLLFADLHHYPGIFMGGTEEDLVMIQQKAEKEQCDFIIHAGDLCHAPSKAVDYVNLYNDFSIPSYHCLGNHDSDYTPHEETLSLYHMSNGYYYFDIKGYRMIVCDTNYYLLDGEFIHYSMSNYYKYPEGREYMPPEQLAWIEETILSSPYPCLLISHSSFERADGVKNRKEVQDIIDRANKKRPHSVLMCINGHHHCDYLRLLNNVCYFDVNSASFDYIGGNGHSGYPAELCEEIRLLNHTLAYSDPLHCVVTVDGNRIKIDGMESTMFMGVTREDIGQNPYDRVHREMHPRIQSADLVLL